MNNTNLGATESWILWLLVALAVLNVLVLIWLALRRTDKAATDAAVQGKTELLGAVSTTSERLERELRREVVHR